MNATKLSLGLLALAMLAPLAAAAPVFTATFPEESPDRISIAVDGGVTLAQSDRPFTVNATANVTVHPAEALPTGYTVDILLRNGTGNFTTVATGQSNTTPSAPHTVLSNGTLRLVLHLPTNRTEGLLSIGFLVVLNNTLNGGGNGGQQEPSFGHVVEILYHDPETDSDADGLADAWEEDEFGDLNETAEGDPDGDGYTNEQEFQAGTDPNNPASHPSVTVIGGGGGTLDDRETGTLATVLFLGILVLLVLIGALSGKAEKTATWIGGLVIVAIVASLLVVFLLDLAVLPGDGWDWWSRAEATWEEWVLFVAATLVIAVPAVAMMLKLKGKEEVAVTIGFVLIMVVVAILFWVVFHVLSFPVPWF